MADGGQTSRAGNALQKRQESLKRWKGSETDRQPVDRSKKKNKIKFDSGTVFLSAVSSGDVEEVKKLLAKGTDINYQNVDGLTALHQACIDETFELVKLLVDGGARLDIRDNEGWTPLHAAASCGSVEIAKYLIKKGTDVASVNNEGELPLDLAEEEDMEDLLTDEIERLGIDAEEARNVEEKLMLEDAQTWLNKNSVREAEDRSGATALHVAASKGYLKVIALLLQLNVDVNAKDSDGWTPLHAAAHWGQTEACEVLSDNGADFTARNKVGQTPIDLAEPDMVKILEQLKKRQNDTIKIKANAPLIKSNLESNAPPPLKRSNTSSTAGHKDPNFNNDSTDIDIAGLMSSITRIKDQNLFLKDISQERKEFEKRSHKDQTSPSPHVKGRYCKAPSFPDSPNEIEEKDKSFGFSKDESESETESETETETSSEEESSAEEKENTVVNSKADSTASESESEEEKKAPVSSRIGRAGVSSANTTNTRTPLNIPSTASTPSRGGVADRYRQNISSQKKDTKTTPVSPLSKTEPSSRVFGTRFRGEQDEKKETTSTRVGSAPVRTTAATTTTNTTTSSGLRGRDGSAASQESKEEPKRRGRRVTARAGTAFVASMLDDDDNDSKSNDVAGKDSTKDSSNPSSEFQPRRNRQAGNTADKTEDIAAKKGRLEQNKENEVGEMSTWRRKRLEREREREEREKEEKEKAREKEREREKERKEREKEKEKEVPSYRSRFRDREKEREQKVREQDLSGKKSTELERKEADVTITHGRRPRRLREDRRGTGVAYMPPEESEDSSKESKEALKNAKANEEVEEKPSYYSRRARHERDSASDDSSKTTDRIRGSRGTATGMGAATDTRVPLSTAKDNTIRVTETDPKKLQVQLQEAHIEIQQYKVKLETTMQEKEKLEQKLTQLTEDLKQLNDLKSENSRLKEENGALIRVISKLSKPPT